jgi:hypothetical protein
MNKSLRFIKNSIWANPNNFNSHWVPVPPVWPRRFAAAGGDTGVHLHLIAIVVAIALQRLLFLGIWVDKSADN